MQWIKPQESEHYHGDGANHDAWPTGFAVCVVSNTGQDPAIVESVAEVVGKHLDRSCAIDVVVVSEEQRWYDILCEARRAKSLPDALRRARRAGSPVVAPKSPLGKKEQEAAEETERDAQGAAPPG